MLRDRASRQEPPRSARQARSSPCATARAARTMERLIAAQGGDPAVVSDPSLLPSAPHDDRRARQERGFVGSIDAREIGRRGAHHGRGASPSRRHHRSRGGHRDPRQARRSRRARRAPRPSSRASPLPARLHRACSLRSASPPALPASRPLILERITPTIADAAAKPRRSSDVLLHLRPGAAYRRRRSPA